MTDKPTQPVDEPEVPVSCAVCGQEKAKTADNFEIYWSHQRWYWRPVCRECRKLAHDEQRTMRQARLKKVVGQMLAEGVPLSCREAMRRFGRTDDRTMRKDWKELADSGQLPSKPGPANVYDEDHLAKWQEQGYTSSGPAGQIIIEIQERLRAFIEQIRRTEERHRNPDAMPFWTEQLTVASALMEEAFSEVSGETIDNLIAEIRSDTKDGER